MSHTVALLNIKEAADMFGVSRRTIERKIKAGEISGTQTVSHGNETRVYVNELNRIFGEPKSATNSQKQGGRVRHGMRQTNATLSHTVALTDPKDAHIATLREQLELERRRNEEAQEREKAEKARADQMEREAAELRRVVEALKQKLLEAPKPPERRGLLAWVLGR